MRASMGPILQLNHDLGTCDQGYLVLYITNVCVYCTTVGYSNAHTCRSMCTYLFSVQMTGQPQRRVRTSDKDTYTDEDMLAGQSIARRTIKMHWITLLNTVVFTCCTLPYLDRFIRSSPWKTPLHTRRGWQKTPNGQSGLLLVESTALCISLSFTGPLWIARSSCDKLIYHIL